LLFFSDFHTFQGDVLLIRNDARDGTLFPEITSDWSLNEDDEENKSFSRMHMLDQFKGEDGIYHFK